MSAAFEADRVDLAREARFRIGGLEVRPSRREVRAGGVSEILEPRVMQVLVALARQGGEVVSRTELVASCWDGRVVTDDAINRCIARVRRLGDAHAAFRIETVPRVGYRLVALDSGAAAPVPPSVSAKPARGLSKRRWIQAAALGIAATVVAAAAAAWVQRPPRYEALPVRALISTPMIERHPAFSPDGTMIAYAAGPNSFQRDILVRRLAGGDPIRMTDEAGDEAGLSWSPDGGRIAYILYVQGEPCRIRVRTIPAGPPVEVGRCRVDERSRASWSADGGHIYFVDREAKHLPRRIYRLALATSERTAVTQPPAGAVGDTEPSVSPDGRWLAFARHFGAHASELVIKSVATGRERVVAAGEFAGSGWTQDSRSLLTVTDRPGVSTVWAYPIGGGPPQNLWSHFLNLGRVVTGPNGLMAVELEANQSTLARARRPGETSPLILEDASGLTWSPAVARDGTIAMASNRSGENAVWVMRPGEPARQIAAFGLDRPFGLRWSAGGERLAFVVTGDRGARLHVMSPLGERLAVREMAMADAGWPVWLADDRTLAMPLRERDGWRIWRVDPFSAAPPTPMTDFGWVAVRVRGPELFGVRVDAPGVWRIGSRMRRLTSAPTAERPNEWDVSDDAVVYVDDGRPEGRPVMAQPLDGGPPRQLADAPRIYWDSGIALGPHGDDVIYGFGSSRGGDISLFRLTRR